MQNCKKIKMNFFLYLIIIVCAAQHSVGANVVGGAFGKKAQEWDRASWTSGETAELIRLFVEENGLHNCYVLREPPPGTLELRCAPDFDFDFSFGLRPAPPFKTVRIRALASNTF